MSKILKERLTYESGPIKERKLVEFEFFDKKGRVIKIKSDSGQEAEYHYYNIFNREYSFILYNNSHPRLFSISKRKKLRNELTKISTKYHMTYTEIGKKNIVEIISIYDSNDRTISRTMFDDSLDYISIYKYEYNSDGLITHKQEIKEDLNGLVDHVIQEYSYKFNPDGILEEIDKNGNHTATFDGLGEHILSEPGYIYEYDHEGELVKKINLNDNTITEYENTYWD